MNHEKKLNTPAWTKYRINAEKLDALRVWQVNESKEDRGWPEIAIPSTDFSMSNPGVRHLYSRNSAETPAYGMEMQSARADLRKLKVAYYKLRRNVRLSLTDVLNRGGI